VSADQPPDDSAQFAEFLDDFYAECDEHLAAVRQGLLALEPLLPAGRPDRAVLDELFRSFHSLKGLSGMVGLGAAEQVAHQLEAILRQLRQGGGPLTAASFDALLLGVRTLEQVLAAHRARAPLPAIAAVVERLAAVAAPEPPPPDPASALTADDQAAVDAARLRGDPLWTARFTPSPALAERGVNVNTVRARLQALGALIRAAPQVAPGGGVSFEFLVAGRLDEAARAELEADGAALAPFAPPPPPEPPPPESPPPEPPPPEPPPPGPAAAGQPSHVVRVDLERLDELLRLVGELTVARARLDDQLEHVAPLLPLAERRALQETGQAIARRLRDLRAAVVRTRMVPVAEAFARVQFVVRDLARELGRPVTVTARGQETEVDKYLIERMLDPLLHLARNAVSHGIEPQAGRLAAGKPPGGVVALRASAGGDRVTITVEDDGRGIDAAAVAARARALGLIDGDRPLDQEALLDVLCAPGFSTRAEADRVSGRGVGLDVVRTAVRELNGALALDTAPGRGAAFRITLPLTLLVVDALLAAAGGQVFAVPLTRVREVVEVAPERVTGVEGRELTLHRGRALPLLRLARRFGLEEPQGGGRFAFVVAEDDDGADPVGVVVDRLLGKREIVVRPIGDALGRTPGIGGATELGDGRPVLIIDVPGLIAGQG
jgi:two-component system chemotaxis sensor kinase CheA